MAEPVDRLFVRCGELVSLADGPAQGARRAADMRRLGLIPDGAVAVRDGLVVEVGTTVDLRGRFAGADEVDLDGFVVLPGLVDASTALAVDDRDAARRGLDAHAVLGTTAVSVAATGAGGVEVLNDVAGQHAVHVHRVLATSAADAVSAVRGRCDACLASFHGVPDRATLHAAAAMAHGAGLRLRVEVDVRSMGGTELAVEAGADVVERLDRVSRGGRERLAASDVVAVLLPAVSFAARRGAPPGRGLVDAGCAIALGSGHGMGAGGTRSMPAAMGFAASLLGLAAGECVTAATLNAAAAIGRDAQCGSLHAGKRADLVAFDVDSYRALAGTPGGNPAVLTVVAGEPLVANVRDWQVRP